MGNFIANQIKKSYETKQAIYEILLGHIICAVVEEKIFDKGFN